MSQGFNFVVLPTADANGSPIPEALLGPVYDRAREAFAAAFGGFTESSGFGGWFNGSAVVSEPIRILESFGDDNPEARKATAELIKLGLGQAAVMAGFKPGTAEFI
jgi:hypothetical protein